MSKDTPDYDILIAGGGMVGSMLAAALAQQQDLRIGLLEASKPDAFEPGTDPQYDIRVSALSIATQRMLERVGAWPWITGRRACPYREMAVWDGEAGGKVHFDANDIGAPALGHIVENRVLQLALFDTLQTLDNVELRCPARLGHYRCKGEGIVATLDSGETVTARLLVGADGARSSVRRLAQIETEQSRYDQHALVASVVTALPQQSITWQRFMPTGPQAFLPLCGSRASMVWYHSGEEVDRLISLDDEAFANELMAEFPERLGQIESVTGRASFPITKAHACRYIAERVALIGDAAHTVHPLAGQGVNLGMLDAAVLSDVLLDAHSRGRDLSSSRCLRRYERWRRGDNALMINALDGIHQAFLPRPAAVRGVRSAALQLADRGGPFKRFVMRYAMGTQGRLPALAR